MTRRLATILIVSQFLIDLAFAFYLWQNQAWQLKMTEIVEGLLRSSVN